MTLYNPLVHLAEVDLEKTISDGSWAAALAASAALIILVGLAIVLNKRLPAFKPALFILIVTIVLGTTLGISGATVYLNIKSAAGGPVHWHADFEVWACGNELALRDPHGVLSNKIGTPTLHEHDDKRIHLEGVPLKIPEDASLGKFMRVVGGDISSRSLIMPLNSDNYFENQAGRQDGDGPGSPSPQLVRPFIHTNKDGTYASFISGEKCGDKTAEVQVFVYKYNEHDKTYTQTKVTNPENYGITHHSNIPPGDCVIMEFEAAKDRTDKLCKQYGIHDTTRCQQFGVKANERSICDSKEITAASPPSTSSQDAALRGRCHEEAQDPTKGISADCAKLQGVF